MSEENNNIETEFTEVTGKSAIQQSSFIDQMGDFFQGNVKYVTIGIGVILIAVLGYFGYQKFIITPKNIDSAKALYIGESHFADTQNWEAVINGDSLGNTGLLAAANKFEGYAGANIANYDMGIASLNLGKYDDAIKFLDKTSFEDENIETARIGAIGDALAGLEKFADAEVKYKEAYTRRPKNEMTAPLYLLKLATINEIIENYEEATKYYTDLIENFPNSQYASKAKKYRVLTEKGTSLYKIQ